MITPHSHRFLKIVCVAGLLAPAIQPLAAQTCDSSCQQFITTTDTAISSFMSTSTGTQHPVILAGNLFYANGSLVDNMSEGFLLDYVDGLKAAGVQRVDLNPGVFTINDPTATALYDAVVQRIRQLGMQLAINPQIDTADAEQLSSFADFQSMAVMTYPALAQRYQPDNFVIVHEPTTQDARLGASPTTQQWDTFVRTLAPLIKAASPHTRVGAGGFYDAAENTFFQDFVGIPTCTGSNANSGCLDFMTMDIYDYTTFTQLDGWIEAAQQSGKAIYVEETWAPKDLPNPLPPDWQSLPGGLDSIALVGTCNIAFAQLDVNWLDAMLQWGAVNSLEAVTAFSTPAFFYYGTTHPGDVDTDTVYIPALEQAVQAGQTPTAAGQGFVTLNGQHGIKIATSVSSASYATLPSVFNPDCGTAENPCNANTTVAPDELVSAFGVDLANTTALDGTFPTNLGGTTMTLVDSSNTSYKVPLYFVTTGQVNYYVPANVQTGPAKISIQSGDGTVTTGIVLVAGVMPGLYTASANGKGAPSAIAIIQHADGSRTSVDTFTCSGGTCSPAPLSVVASDTLVVEFFGTGVRHVSSLSSVTATANGVNAPVQYAGASGYTGEDQINIQIPNSLFGAGTVNIALTADGQTSNTVTLDLE